MALDCCSGTSVLGFFYIKGILYVLCSGPPLWSNVQSFGFDFRRYQILWKVVGLERGPLSLLSTTEELLERKSSGSGLETREYEYVRRGYAARTTAT
jgi:hypothetical protein